MRPVKRKLLVPSVPGRLNEPLTATQREQRLALRFLRVGATQWAPDRRPRALRSTVKRTGEAAPPSVNATIAPGFGFVVAAASALGPPAAARNAAGVSVRAVSRAGGAGPGVAVTVRVVCAAACRPTGSVTVAVAVCVPVPANGCVTEG